MSNESRSTILIVDDTEINLEILEGLLENDYEIDIAMDGPSALELAGEDPPDIILLDIMMPGMDGYEVCEKLKADESTRKIPVIFITAMSEEKDEKKGLQLGAVDYITKPFSPEIVKARIKTHLQLKQQVRVLEENLKLQEEIEHITRHDLKTPLSAVLRIPGMMKAGGNLTREQVEMMGMMESSGYRMLEIINNSLNLVQMEKGTYRLNPVNLDLLKLIRQVRNESLELIRMKNLSIGVECRGREAGESDLFEVHGEEVLCYSMLANLLKNALEASPKDSRVTITLDDAPKDPSMAGIRIHNLGLVPKEIQDRFFDKYTTSGKKEGTGLGTYSAKLVAETLGGSINFESSEKEGTTVRVCLPEKAENLVCEGEDLLDDTGEDKGQVPCGFNVLIVDDYELMRRLVINGIRQMGIDSYKEAGDGHSAITLLNEEKFDLIISDNNMPVMTGLELAQYVKTKAQFRDIPFIMMTGESRQETILKAVKAGIKTFLVKPFPADLLIKKIKAVCIP